MVKRAFQQATRSLWTGRAEIAVEEAATDPATGRVQPQERVIAREVPCRLSYRAARGFRRARSTQETGGAARVEQEITLYLSPEVEVPAGSRITVTQNGVTRRYGRSGLGQMYSCHQEIPLEYWTGREWA